MDAAFSGMSVFNNFLLIDASDRSKISSDKSAYFSRRLPLKIRYQEKKMTIEIKKTLIENTIGRNVITEKKIK